MISWSITFTQGHIFGFGTMVVVSYQSISGLAFVNKINKLGKQRSWRFPKENSDILIYNETWCVVEQHIAWEMRIPTVSCIYVFYLLTLFH